MILPDPSDHALELELPHSAVIHSVQREPMMIIGVLVLLLLGSVIFSYRVWSETGRTRLGDDLTIALNGPPPAVEPLILQEVTRDVAKQSNDATPFSTKPVPPAPPFIFKGSATDLERAVDCLAATIFYEAGNETLQGQMAVVQVVLNRVRHPAYPKTVCGVVFQGHERQTGCQFSYTCDGSLVRQPSADAWQRFRGIGRAMLGGQIYAPVGSATHYHTDWVLPKWSAQLEKVRAEGTHLFFRWPGFWGAPKALRGAYVGNEPAFAKLAMLSPAHAVAASMMPPLSDIDVSGSLTAEMGYNSTAYVPGLTGEPLYPLPSDPNAAGFVPAGPAKSVADDKAHGQFILQVSSATNASSLTDLAQQTCGARDYCKVMVWTDPLSTPKVFPISDAHLASLAFSYLRNRQQGFEKPLWNCNIFDRPDKRQCMRGRLGSAPKPLMPAQLQPTPAQAAASPAAKSGKKKGKPTPAAIDPPTVPTTLPAPQ
jgi:hypothetical protein